jgi:hypothetical protein
LKSLTIANLTFSFAGGEKWWKMQKMKVDEKFKIKFATKKKG